MGSRRLSSARPAFKDEAMPVTVSDLSRPLPPYDSPRPSGGNKKASVAKAFIALLAGAVIAGCASGAGTLTPARQSGTSSALKQASNISRALPAASPTPYPAELAACAGASGPAQAACQVQKQATGPQNIPLYGLSPSQLRAAYGLPPLPATPAPGVPPPPGPPVQPSGPLVAVIAAYDDGPAKDDMNKYRQYYGIPQCNDGGPAGTACFTKVQMHPTPGAPPPAPKPPGNSPDSVSWADEIALDLAMVSASCPNCRILLVEALGQDLDSLADAVNTAASYNPVAISNSWGVPEAGNVANIDPAAQAAFNHPGIAITASAGDLGSGQVQFPASSPYVTSVGGTTLQPALGTARGWTETVWNGSGNGCSIMVGVPAWQTNAAGCSNRAVPDVSMLADSTVGAAVFSSSEHGWVALGGTSLGAPFVAGLYGAANDYGAGTVGAPSLYANLGGLNPIAGAVNGSPNGLAGF
jgi:subtilase family serine protease